MDDFFQERFAPPGYRLHRLEILNWGTFDSEATGRIHSVEPKGKTSLLIGQNGSGKSTLADALLTLLVRPQIRSYNVAAGSHGRKRERKESTYIKGAYAHGSTADDNRAQTKFLRPDGRHFSGILAYFENEALEKGFTLAQVLWLDSGQQTKRFCCHASMNIRALEAFGELRSEGLKKQLETRGFHVTDSFPTYEKWFRTELGMQSKAMDVFNQTVSVKDIESLNQFIRRHMLEAKPWRETLDSILNHFVQLSEAYSRLVDAKKQLEALTPVAELGEQFGELTRTLGEKEQLRDASDAFFRQRTSELCQVAREEWSTELRRLDDAIGRLDQRHKAIRERIRKLKNDLESASSERLRQLPGEIKLAETELERLRENLSRFLAALEKAGIEASAVERRERFEALRGELQAALPEREREREDLTERQFRLDRERRDEDVKNRELEAEIADLQARPTNLPRSHEAMRRRMCSELGIDPKQLPFAAELIAVRPEDREWEGAAETVLRGFGLSLLVADRHYRDVSRFVNTNRMTDAEGRGQRLVYLRISPKEEEMDLQRNRDSGSRSLFHRLRIKPGHRLTEWVLNELRRRADFLCCDTLTEFQQANARALTRERQVKFGPDRHEKDDRSKVADSRNFVLGWDNKEKLELLKADYAAGVRRVRELEAQVTAARRRIDQLASRIDGARTALEIDDFARMDTGAKEGEIADLLAEKEQLEKSDDRVLALRDNLRQAETEEAEVEVEKSSMVESRGGVKGYITEAKRMEKEALAKLEEYRRSDQWVHFESHFDVIAAEISGRELTVRNVQAEYNAFRAAQQSAVDQVVRQRRPVEDRITKAMSRFLREFPGVATSEGLEATTGSLDEFIALHNRIEADDLPRYEARFRERLREKVLDEISLFQTMLGNEADEIKDKIAVLNRALEAIDYDEKAGTTMRLEPLPTRDREIADFRQQLRDCTAGLLENTDEALEACYHRVEKLIDALRSENTRWRDKVIDVREWFDFAARETVRETGEEKNYHSDSQGQSGGEKAKLAFTILVAAVVYQFDIDPRDRRSGRFHFVVVDEMFSKVDDDYAAYAMRLFEQFGLQLLIVAPFDAKARVTEPFVDFYLHVVKHENRSQVYTMTAEEFQERFGEAAA
ncbi:MAG: SbcC/MukB-like Walker B domain-containing protein [Verrucomicrobiota bacterium]